MSHRPEDSRTERRGWIHFGIAAGILVIALGGLGFAVTYMKISLQKSPVPWPEGTLVSDDFRLLNIPTELGPFRMPDSDGEIVLEGDILDSLGVGRPVDKDRLPERMSNWYMIRRYVDTRREENSPYRFWQLEAYYYTGEYRTVPHVPERCLPAAGAEPVEGYSGPVHFEVPPLGKDRPLWNTGKLTFQRAAYATTTGRMQEDRLMVVYYVFSINGEPEDSWVQVRKQLVWPFDKYCYFGKIQFSPLGPGNIEDLDEANEAAQEFMSHALPLVIRHFPSVNDIRDLSERE